MKLSNLIGLNKGDIISIVGAGGKTSLMFTLAEELREEYKLLVTTTTKIFLPGKNQYDFIAIDEGDIRKISCCSNRGIYVFGSLVNGEGKLIGINTKTLDEIASNFDCTLVEADGSKGKQLKGWNKTEPVISPKTQKTIGVVSIEAIGKEISSENVHRLEEFLSITNAVEGSLVSVDNILSLILHQNGLYKHSIGERILFINKVENNRQIALANELIDCIRFKSESQGLIDKIIWGSLRNKEYKKA